MDYENVSKGNVALSLGTLFGATQLLPESPVFTALSAETTIAGLLFFYALMSLISSLLKHRAPTMSGLVDFNAFCGAGLVLVGLFQVVNPPQLAVISAALITFLGLPVLLLTLTGDK